MDPLWLTKIDLTSRLTHRVVRMQSWRCFLRVTGLTARFRGFQGRPDSGIQNVFFFAKIMGKMRFRRPIQKMHPKMDLEKGNWCNKSMKIHETSMNIYLGGGFKHLLFSPRKLGKIHIFTHIFQMGLETTNQVCMITQICFMGFDIFTFTWKA